MSEPYAFTDPMVAQARGIAVTNALQQQQRDADRQATLRTTGNALATGDLTFGAGTLFRSGDIQGGLQVQNIAQERQDASDQADTAQKAALLKLTADTATRLSAFHQSQVNQPGADPAAATQRTLAAFDEAVPQLKAAGGTDEDIAQIRAHIAHDPQATFAGLGAAAAKELGYDVKVVDGNVIAVDKASGKSRLIASTSGVAGAAAPKPAMTAGQQDPDATFLDPAYAGQGGGATPGADAVWASIKQQESGGQASPGTAVGPDTPYGHALGSTQMLPATAEAMARKLGIPWNPALMRENSPKALAYQDALGRAYFEEGVQKGGGDLAQGAAYYFGGPDPALHGPKTKAYVQQVMARAGGAAAAAPSGGQDTLSGGDGADAIPPGTVDANGVLHLAPHQPEWVSDGHGGLKNTKTGNTKADKTFQAPPVEVDPNEVKMVLEGRYPAPTSGRAATDPKWQALLAAAAAQDPQFDAANYATRVKTRQSFLSGPQSQNITALNTVVGHLDALDHSIDHLGNYGGFPGSTMNNRVAHFIAAESGTDQRLADFAAKKTAVANELTRVFRGSGGAEADIQGYLKQLSDASSPETLHTTVKAIANLIHSRLSAVADSYQQGMGLSKDPMEFLHPEQQRAFSRLSGVPAQSAATQPAAGVSPAAVGALQRARAAIQSGADPAKVKQRLVAAGINPADL